MRLPHKTEWLLVRKPTIRIERTREPVVLSLAQTIEWIRKERPLIWLGSIFSVPEPSGFPSGYTLTRSLLELVFGPEMPEANRDKIIETLLPRWPLEALLDEFEFLGFDLSESLLTFFKNVNDSAGPSGLHKAVVSYYQQGLASRPLCVTTNWDTLQENAFRNAGYSVVIGGPAQMPDASFGKEGGHTSTIFLYHPHGSFETRDIVCSLKREQSQLALSMEIMRHPTLFLGYSGYEPSLYRRLEFNAAQLWCIRDVADFEIPAKRRLLSRPNTFVYVGDMRELLRALGVLEGDVDLTSKHLALDGRVPPKVTEVLRLAILSFLDPNLCVDLFANTLTSFYPEPEATIRYVSLLRAVISHVRNRTYHPGLSLSLMSAARFRDSEQTWISLLAYLLRMTDDLDSKVVEQMLKLADDAAREAGESGSHEDRAVYMPGVLLNRTKLYKGYVGMADQVDDEKLYVVPTLMGSDIAAEGENMELLAFHYLREGQGELAQNCFDYAATSFYLRGLWRAGRLNEWAANNTESMKNIAKRNTLVIPDKGV
jgi:hypothetical protein